tara:strand:- start:435 stop:668 length:234 start_codon:yes stop_codon:yes gene_type:complete
MANKLNNRLKQLSKKYYGTEDFSRLQPYQLDKLASWVTWHEDKGKNQSRKAEMALRQNKKFSGSRRDHTKTKLKQTH